MSEVAPRIGVALPSTHNSTGTFTLTRGYRRRSFSMREGQEARRDVWAMQILGSWTRQDSKSNRRVKKVKHELLAAVPHLHHPAIRCDECSCQRSDLHHQKAELQGR